MAYLDGFQGQSGGLGVKICVWMVFSHDVLVGLGFRLDVVGQGRWPPDLHRVGFQSQL